MSSTSDGGITVCVNESGLMCDAWRLSDVTTCVSSAFFACCVSCQSASSA